MAWELVKSLADAFRSRFGERHHHNRSDGWRVGVHVGPLADPRTLINRRTAHLRRVISLPPPHAGPGARGGAARTSGSWRLQFFTGFHVKPILDRVRAGGSLHGSIVIS